MNIQLKKGVMEIVVLSMLRRRDFYGYELVSEISKYIEMSEGTIYPLLNRFKKDGLVDTYLPNLITDRRESIIKLPRPAVLNISNR